ncbi:MAG: SufS family cysteine desulfurase [Patescibacteria group bacterium]|jgi:cysteine desulfurase/selenocysteine lyase
MYKSDFPLLQYTNVAWLDNAATTQKPQVVLDKMTEFYTHYNANVHRGLYTLSVQATALYESARGTVQAFIHAGAPEEIIFTSGTTAGINLLATSLGELLIKPGDEILLSPMEHHSNLVPWQLLAKRKQAKLTFFDLTSDTEIDLNTLAGKITDRVKIISLAHISNAAGTVHPIKQIIELAHKNHIPVIIDGAQSVGHVPVNVQELDCDFLVWSGHKMCGPTGTGVLYGKKRWLEQMEPWQGGGDMIKEVTLEQATWNELPYKFEAGTPNIAGVIGLAAAIEYLEKIGIKKIERVTSERYHYLLTSLQQLDFIKLHGVNKINHGIVSFTMDIAHPHDIAQILDEHNVAVRAGHHCCQPLMHIWQVPATTRASVYFYNEPEDIDKLINGLKKVYDTFRPHP